MKIEEGEPVANCENCGAISGEDVKMNFPNTPTCVSCGSELNRVVIADETTQIEQ